MRALWCLTLGVAALAGCSKSDDNEMLAEAPSSYNTPGLAADAASEPSAEFATLIPRRSHFYDEKNGLIYSYIAAISEDDRKAGRAAGAVISFTYLGEENGRHVLARVSSSGSILGRASCSKPCRIITYDDGSQLAYNEGSIIGGAFSDALAGRLEIAPLANERQMTFPQSATPTPVSPSQNAGSGWSANEAALIAAWLNLNEKCRGGTNAEEVAVACDHRDGEASERLVRANICYGREGEYGYQHQMHRCGPGSLRLN